MNNRNKKLIVDALTKLTSDFVTLRGKQYYESICKYVVDNFDIDYAFIGTLNQFSDQLEVQAGWALDKPFELVTFDLEGTPCKNVLSKNIAVYDEGIQKAFPKNKLLKQIQAQAYMGITLYNRDREPLGVFAVLSKNKFSETEHLQQLLKLFVESIGAEVQRHKSEKITNELKNKAYYDPLTKLPNRLLLTDRMRQAIRNQARTKKMVGVCLLDLDGFKAVNDKLGHEAGDYVLVNVARRIEHLIRPEDTISRLGGDEFVLVLTDVNTPDDIARILVRIVTEIAKPYNYNDTQITTISASIGATIYPEDNCDDDMLLRHADQAMYKAKENGKNQFYFFNIKEHNKIKANFKALQRIEKAIDQGQFELYFQPKLCIHTLTIKSVEVLARWNHPIMDVLLPSEFLPLIENDDIIFKFDTWVIKESLKTIKKLKEQNIDIDLAINLSAKQFKQRNFVEVVKQLADEVDFNYSYFKNIEFEITENSALESVNHTNDIIRELKELGIRTSLDDFGTGYSSLLHLKELNINCIKIDKSFIADMLSDPQDMAIVKAIISLSKVFQLDVVSEGVESIEQIMMLFELGTDYVQGFHIAKPLTYKKLVNYINKYEPDPRLKISPKNMPQRADFELLLAESFHKYWLSIVYEALIEEKTSDLPELSHNSCRLGKWIQTKGIQYFSDLKSFQKLVAVHKQIHDEVFDIIEDLKKTKREVRQSDFNKINRLKNNLMLVIEKLHEEHRVEKLQKEIDNESK